MSDKESPQENQGASPIGEIEHGPSGLDAFLDANQKKLMVIATLLVIGVVAYVVITGLQQSAREKAAAEISAANDLPALRALHEEHKNTPAGAVALEKIALIQWQDQRQQEAIETLESIVSDYPDHPLLGSIHMALGTYHRQLEQFDAAKSSFELAVASDSAVSSAALVALGDLALRGNDTDAANESFEKVSILFGERHSNFKQIAENHQKLVGTIAPTELAPVPKVEEPKPTGTSLDLPPLPALPGVSPTPKPTLPIEPIAPVPTPTENN